MAEGPRHEPALHVAWIAAESGEAPSRDPVAHAGHAICLVTSGWVEMEVGHRIRASAGALIVMPSQTPHRMLACSDDYRCVGVGFCPTCLALDPQSPLMAPLRQVRHGAPPVREVEASRLALLQERFARLAEELERDVPEAEALAVAWLHLILGEVCRAGPRHPAPPAGSLSARALSWIHTHALSPVSLAHAAAALHCTPSHLATVVKRDTGHTVGQWLASIRVSSASHWLLHSDAAVEAIAERVGWRDPTHFIRQFKRHTGATPAAFRKARRGR